MKLYINCLKWHPNVLFGLLHVSFCAITVIELGTDVLFLKRKCRVFSHGKFTGSLKQAYYA